MREKKSKKSNSPNVTKKPVKASTKSNAPRVPKHPARASINQHKPEAVASANESRPPKVIRILKSAKGAIIGAGALALAVSAILALVPHRGHLRVQFDHVSVSPAAVPLSQFRPVVGKFAPAMLREQSSSFTSPYAVQGLFHLANPSTSTAVRTTATPSSSGTRTTSSPTTTRSSTTTTETSEPTPLTTTGGSSPTTSGESPGARGGQTRLVLPKPYSDELARELRDLGLHIDPAILLRTLPTRPLFKAFVDIQTLPTTDPSGSVIPQLSPAEAARRLVAIFAHVRLKGADDPVSSQKEPLGMVLDVQVSMENARDVPVDIYWQILGAGSDSQQLNAEWVQSTPAYQLKATDDTDAGAFKLWVPLPSEKGDYAISITAKSTEEAGLPNASILTETFH